MSSSVQDKKPISVLISGTGSNLQALIDAEQDYNYQVALVISNRPDTFGVERAKQHGITTVVVDHTIYKTRAEFDTQLAKTLQEHRIDTVILAGFMRILTPEFTNLFSGKMLNIHPSLLPKYPGLNTHQKALDNQDKEHGLSIHFVTSELDGGPVILQAKFTVGENESVAKLQEQVQILEHQAYPKVVNWLVQSQIQLRNNQAYFNNQLITEPLQLS